MCKCCKDDKKASGSSHYSFIDVSGSNNGGTTEEASDDGSTTGSSGSSGSTTGSSGPTFEASKKCENDGDTLGGKIPNEECAELIKTRCSVAYGQYKDYNGSQ